MKKIIIAFSLLFSVNAFAIDQMYNWNGLEFVTSGNVTHVHPASPESTRLRGGWVVDISDVEPKLTATHNYPLKHSSNPPAKVSVNWPIDTRKVSDSAAKAAKAAAAGAATGNGYLLLASIVCSFVCDPLKQALQEWGVDNLSLAPDGSLYVSVPDPGTIFEESQGVTFHIIGRQEVFGYSLESVCSAYAKVRAAEGWSYAGLSGTSCLLRGGTHIQSFATLERSSSCLPGTPVVNGVCNGTAPTVSTSLGTYLDSSYMGKGWSRHWADITAGLVAAGENVFTDGTGATITGPAIVPVSVTETQTQINVLPGTTTPVSPGHTGPSDSATQTVRSITNAHNNYRPGSASSGPSMTTTQKTTTTTSITNNVTNVTNIVNETTTETDEAPEETVSDSPMPDLPELYEQKYKDGLTGVVTAKIAELKQTPLFQLPNSLMGDLPSSGQCPAWQLDLNFASWANFGIHSIGADCAIWDFAALVVLISAAILCRALIFGG